MAPIRCCFDHSSLALRCRKGAIHPIIRSPRRRGRAAWALSFNHGLDRLWSWLVGLRELKMRDIVTGTAYEKCLQHAAFLGIDLVRAIEPILTSQCFHRRRGREHPIGVACCLEARGDVDGITPNVISELARTNDP